VFHGGLYLLSEERRVSVTRLKQLLTQSSPYSTTVAIGKLTSRLMACVARLWPDRHWQTMGLQALLGAPIYVAVVGILDPDTRNLLRLAAGRFGWSGKKGQAA